MKTLACFSVLSLALSLSACPSPPKTRVVFIFCDVTNSLGETESAKVAVHAADLLDSLPPGTLYRVYPILAETGQLEPLAQGKIERENDPNLEKALRKSRRDQLAEDLSHLYHVSNLTRYDNRTCILNALGFAFNQFLEFEDDKKYERELVLISDMMEECNDTPLKRPIDIRKGNITQEVNLAGEFPQGLDFSRIIVNIITPVTEETYIKYDPKSHPPMSSLQNFWFNVFTRCKVPADDIQKPDRFFWSNGVLPNRYAPKNLTVR